MACKMCGIKTYKEFCSDSCKTKYLHTLEKFIESQEQNKVVLENKTLYELAKEYVNGNK